ncbi:helix-turn-helix domain-containing protein [Methylobacterium sp. J-088]|uniref:helix-turn-helix domain-containing protein n=1 Tax=Methylobacterium sp. J-088 TaxID=2836664 RepID=UPI001FB8A653|nr:helix-turn-helix domain-containing protein [Methylobacterium sp. J-088]MCJ2062780.1 helix-turn-helix domain-containing protein [Methylobacterium sp. J-088]
MRTLFSTADEKPKNSFRRWRETVFERIVPVELTAADPEAFQGTLEVADVGPLLITRLRQSAIRIEATPGTIRRRAKHDTLNVVIALNGEVISSQDDRTAIQRAGDIAVLDWRPVLIDVYSYSQALFIEVPRERLERALGSTRRYTALTLGADQASTSLVTTFFNQLVRTYAGLPSDTADQMAAIGIDLLIAGIAERLAREAPKPLQGTLIVQRAMAFIEANSGDPSLDPATLAAAVGVSLRYLQQLFRGHERNIADQIWQRRLEIAAQRLADPGYAHLTVGTLAYGCGFSDQAHFGRRFKHRHGLPPGEYRWRSLNSMPLVG